MVKYFCDACGKEMKNQGKGFSYLCHLDEIKPSYVDNYFNGVSGRSINTNICNACYNSILGEAVKKFKEIQKANGITIKSELTPLSITPLHAE